MFGTVLTTAVTLMHAYIFWRVSSLPMVQRLMPRSWLGVIAVVLWCVFFLGRIQRHGDTGILATFFEIFTMQWTAILLLCATCLLLADIVTGFGLIFSQYAPSLRTAALLAGLLMSITALFQALRPPVVNDYDVNLTGLPAELDGTVLAVVSDTHLGPMIGSGWLRARVEQVQKLKPDMVVLLGDIFESHGVDHAGLTPVLKSLSAPLGVWGVLGNHEFYGDLGANLTAFEAAGVRLLRNTSVQIRPGLVLAGVDYLRRGRRSGNELDPVAAALDSRPEGATIFLSHAPVSAGEAARAGAALMLSGHTHGGQLWPFGYFVRQEYPMLAGRFEVGGMSVIVSRGAGTWGPRMRLWYPGEILRITLRSIGA